MADGIGQPDVVPLQSGVAAQPLVPNVQPQVTPDAVGALVNAFHNGAINTQDVIDRIGALGQAKKRALIEEMQEYVSPQAIQSRMAQYGAQGAQANLQTQQAQAASGLVQPLTEKEQADIVQAQNTRLTGPAVAAYTQFNPPIYKLDADGNPTSEYDYAAMSREGAHYVRAQSMLALAANGLKATPMKISDPKTGQPKDVWLNANGEDVTPVRGNKTYEFYNQMRRDAYELFTREPDTSPHVDPTKAATPAGAAAAAAQPETDAESPEIGNLRSALAARLATQGVEPAAASKMVANADPETLLSINAQSAVPAPTIAAEPAGWVNRPAAVLPAQPQIQPAQTQTQQPSPIYMPFSGVATGAAPGSTPLEIKKAMEELPDVQAYNKAKEYYTGFADAASGVRSDPSAVSDLSLAEAYSKLFDPNSAIREFKWEALSQSRPLLELIGNAKAQILKEGSFPPAVRERIIKSGMHLIDTREKSLVPRYQWASQLGAPLDSEQQAILNGVPFSKRYGAGQSPVSNLGPGTKLDSGITVYHVPNTPTQ